jgi:tetratricopeptide (TPR) repeat protein
MSRSLTRTVSAVLILALLAGFLYFLQNVKLPDNLIGRPPLLDERAGRPLQTLYQLEAQAAIEGWTPDRSRLAGDLWRQVGDLRRAVAYWEAADPGTAVLRDRAQAYVQLERWADATDALAQLLALLPDNSPDRAWAQFQLGLIRATYDPARALDLLRAAQPTYGSSAATLVSVLEGTTDPIQIGIALARAELWSHAELAFSQSADPLAAAYGGLARDVQGKDGSPQIDAAVAFAPDNPQVRYLQGLHLRQQYDYPGSLEAMIQAVALDPENPALYAELGRAYQLAGDMTAAERWLKFAVSLDDHFQPLLDAFYDDERTALLNLGLVDEAALPFDATRTPEP